jgi:hypothetical protein
MRKWAGIVIAVAAWLWAGAARAADVNAILPQLNLPGFTVTPFLTERGEYQSNVFQAPSGARDDFILKTVPGVVVELPFGPHRLDLGARAEILRYLDLDTQDTEHYYVLGLLGLNFPGGLTLKTREDFARTSDPPGTELTGRIQSTINTVTPEAEYGLGDRVAVGLNYSWTHVSFDTIPQLDRDEQVIGATGFWKFQPKSALLANYSFGWKEFDDSIRDVTRHLIMAGVRGDLTSRVTSTLRVGIEDRQPSRSGLTTYLGLVASGDLVFRPTSRTTLSFIADRSVGESVFESNLFYVATIGTLAVEHRLLPKVTVSARVWGGTSRYPDKVTLQGQTNWREDNIFGAGASIEYAARRWLSLGLDYTRQQRDSNFSDFNFVNDIVGLRVTFSF